MRQTINFKVSIMALLTIAFIATSCTKPDDRDQFEGLYLVDASGSMTLHGVSQNLTSPLNVSHETMTLTKSATSSGEMIASGFLDVSATVSGNTIQFDSFAETYTYENGVSIQAKYDVKKGTLNGNVLTFKLEISGTSYYQGSAVPVDGSIVCIATKQ